MEQLNTYGVAEYRCPWYKRLVNKLPGSRSVPFTHFKPNEEYKDALYTNTNIRFSLWDRIRILIHGNCSVRTRVLVKDEIGYMTPTECDISTIW